MNRNDWKACYWFDKGLNRQRITRQSPARAYISEALDTIQDQVVEAKIDAWVQDQIDQTVQAEVDQAWEDRDTASGPSIYREIQRDRRFEALNYWRGYLME